MNCNGNVSQMKSTYFPGKLVVLTNEYFNKQKILKEENDIKQWKSFVERFFSEKCIYCMMLSRDTKEWTFNCGYITLPMVFKSKFEENLNLTGISLDNPEEYAINDGKYLLIVKNFSIIENYDNIQITTNGILKILFDENLKIEIYEFVSKNHTILNDINIPIVNDFGITPQYSRALILSEILTEMNPSITDFVSKLEHY